MLADDVIHNELRGLIRLTSALTRPRGRFRRPARRKEAQRVGQPTLESSLARCFRFVAASVGICLALLRPAAGRAAPVDPRNFLAERRCPDGLLQVTEPRCAAARPRTAADAVRTRRHDWPGSNSGPEGYQASDSFELSPDRFVATWSYGPFGHFVAQHGDGGEIYVVDADTVRIAATEDGGRIGVVQGFFGRACGGTGWVLFPRDVPTGRWDQVVARLWGAPIGEPCRAAVFALTRYRLERTRIPFLIGGRRSDRTLWTIISEHYNEASLQAAAEMERTFLAEGVGRVAWESWTKRPPVGADLSLRCPGTAWSNPPAPGWRLSDCRYSTNVVRLAQPTTGTDYGWPPVGLRLP